MTSAVARAPATYVYAIANTSGAVKIGLAADPVRRKRELNVSDHSALTLVGYAKGTREHERAIHIVLREARLRGEWFDASHPHVRLFLDLISGPAEASDEQAHHREVRRPGPSAPTQRLPSPDTVPYLIEILGGGTAVAAIIGGAHPSTASEMKRRGSIPTKYWPKIIEAARERGIDLTAEKLMQMHTAERGETERVG